MGRVFLEEDVNEWTKFGDGYPPENHKGNLTMYSHDHQCYFFGTVSGGEFSVAYEFGQSVDIQPHDLWKYGESLPSPLADKEQVQKIKNIAVLLEVELVQLRDSQGLKLPFIDTNNLD